MSAPQIVAISNWVADSGDGSFDYNGHVGPLQDMLDEVDEDATF